MRTKFGKMFLAGLFCLLLTSLGRAGETVPNFVFIYIDDLGWRDTGFQGSEFYETPHIDQLAARSMVFTDAYANAPNCAPSRACLMTGLYSPRHGVYTVGDPARGEARFRKLVPIENRTELDGRFTTVAQVLRDAGYVTATVGKWHLGPDPREHGFDINIGGTPGGSPPGGHFSPYRNPQLEDGPPGEYLTDRLTDESIRFLEGHHDQPFFLLLSHYAVHTPLQAPRPLVEKYEQKEPSGGHGHATYAAMIESVDQGVGRLLDAVDRLQLAEKTVVIFYSDNGGYGPATSMDPLRGAKGMLYEGGIRVPLTIYWPGKTVAGSRCQEPVIGSDFYPTLLEMAGIEPPQEYPLDGQSLVPLLIESGEFKREAIYWHFPAYLQAYRDGTGPFRTTPAGAIRAGDWKLIEFFEDGTLELYNLAEDVGEQNNLAGRHPERARQLHRKMQQWRDSVGAAVPTEPNPKYEPPAE